MPVRRHFKIFKWRLKRRWERFEAKVTDLLYGRITPRGRLWAFWWFLKIFEWMFKGLVGLRMALYRHRILKQEFLGCMVVVIGNITVGGTGKTPVVEKIARELNARGRKVAILSRGYKRRESSFWKKILSLIDEEADAPVVVSDGQKVRCDWKRAGDEPYMLANNLPGVAVIVDKNRVKAGAYAIRKFGVDTLLLDDGFQYLPLKSRLRLVLVDQNNPFGNGSLLPRGVLREELKALGRASFVFVTKSDGQVPAELMEKIKQHGPAGVEPIVCTHAPKNLNALDNSNVQPLELLKGAKVFAFSGIAMPESFEKLLMASGAEVVKHLRYTDHYAYEEEDVSQIIAAAEASGAEVLVTTEKDAVRLPYFKTRLPAYYLRMEVEILRGQESFQKAVGEICGEGM